LVSNSAAGWLFAVTDPFSFHSSQIPDAQQSRFAWALFNVQRADVPGGDNSRLVIYQLGAAYLGLAAIQASVLRAAPDARTVRAYLAALLVWDVGHLLATYASLGSARMWDVGGWNATTWGNVASAVSWGFSFFFFLLFLLPSPFSFP
jgi:hypothetical protein